MKPERNTALQVPVELLQNIFSNIISKKDLSNARLTSLRFCAVATPFVFRTVYVQDTNTSAKRLFVQYYQKIIMTSAGY